MENNYVIDFSVENFKSFTTKQTLSLVVASKYKENNLKDNIIETGNDSVPNLLKSIAIYGANASGKSKFIDAFFVFAMFFNMKSFEVGDKNYFYTPFALDLEYRNKPTSFEINFLLKNNICKLFFSYDSNGIKDEILKINNKEVYNIKKQYINEKILNKFEVNLAKETLVKTENKKFINLFLKELVNDGIGGFMMEIFLFLKTKLIVMNNKKSFEETENMIETHKKDILNIINKADPSIINIQKENKVIDFDILPKEIKNIIKNDKNFNEEENKKINFKRITMEHIDSDFNLGLEEESDGTQAIFALSGFLVDIFKNGGVLFFDELDCNLHPDLLVYIVNLFHNKEINKANAQIVFTAHNDILLEKFYNEETEKKDKSILRRDQIYFTSKTSKCQSMLYSLVEFQGVQERDNIAQKYRDGFFGARPELTKMEISGDK